MWKTLKAKVARFLFSQWISSLVIDCGLLFRCFLHVETNFVASLCRNWGDQLLCLLLSSSGEKIEEELKAMRREYCAQSGRYKKILTTTEK